MEFKESLDILLRECHFISSAQELERLIPGAGRFLPPLMAIRYRDERAPSFQWGYPIVPSRRHLLYFQQLFARVAGAALRTPGYSEGLQALSPEQFQEDPYLREASDLLVKTLAEGEFLKLDTVLWAFFADLLRRRLSGDDELQALTQATLPQEAPRLRPIEEALGKMRFRDPARLGEVRVALLHSFNARHEYAWSTVKEVFDEVPSNPIAQALLAHRMVFVVPRGGLHGAGDVSEAFAVRNYRLKAESFTALRALLSQVFQGLLERRAGGQLTPVDGYLLRLIDLEAATEKAQLALGATVAERDPAGREQALMGQIARYLSLQPEPARYLFYHLEEFSRYLIKPIERSLQIPREQLRSFKDPRRVVAMEAAYVEVADDLRRWDFFDRLLGRIRWVTAGEGGALVAGGRPLATQTVPINLDALRQIYRRSRHGTAVFFDLIGFTAKTKSLSRRGEESSTGEEAATFSLLSLAIQRLFSVRRYLKGYGGSPQGFEGDAILDIFPRALNALRYVARFADNYEANRLLRYRPFEGPAGNPYQEGWRVGLATGPYTVISLVGRSNEMSPDAVHERAVGHTVNRASRLNSGKKGGSLLLLGEEGGGLGADDYDPLELFQVRVDGELKLTNSGICSFEDTFQELREQVRDAELPHCLPEVGEGASLCGVRPEFGHYRFALIFEDPEVDKVCLVRRLSREPELKGLEDERCVVYEYVLISRAEFPGLVARDKALGSPPPPGVRSALGPLDPAGLAALRALEARGLSPAEVLGLEEGDPVNGGGALAQAPEHTPTRQSPAPPATSAEIPSSLASERATGGLVEASQAPSAAHRGDWALPAAAQGARGDEARAMLEGQGPLPGGDPSLLWLGAGLDEEEEIGALVDPLAHDGGGIDLLGEGPILPASAPAPAVPRAPTSAPPEPGRSGMPARAVRAPVGATGGGEVRASLDSGGATGGGEVRASLDSGGATGGGEVRASLDSGASSAPARGARIGTQGSEAAEAEAPLSAASQPLYVERGDLEGYGYVLEEGDGPDRPPTAILVGCPRGEVLQDCHRYTPEVMAAQGWALDQVLRRFVLDLDQELREGSSRGTHRLPQGHQVYMLDGGYLFDLARAQR